jgi:hypothetical protein
MIRQMARAVIAAVVILLLSLILVVSSQFLTQSRAGAFLAQANSLRVGMSTFDVAKKLEAIYHGHELTGGMYRPDCSPRDCYIQFLFTNKWLARLRLAPPTGFATTLHIENGLIISRTTAYAAEAGKHSFTLAVDESSSPGYIQDLCAVFFRTDLSGRPWKIQISISPKASQLQRDLVYSFDLSCLTGLGSCGEPTRILPALSQKDILICSERRLPVARQ